MNSVSRSGRRMLVATAGITATALALSACGGSDDGDGGSSGGGSNALIIGTSGKISTIDRQLSINDEKGPAALLYNLDSTEVVDDTTVVFHLKSEIDQVFPQILSSPAGPIVGEDVFSADSVAPG